MKFMNTWQIDESRDAYASHPILGPATKTLADLRDWADSHSDGWCYWPKPARSARLLMELIERDGTAQYHWRFNPEREDVTLAEYRAALRPVKGFRTWVRKEIDPDAFEIHEAQA